MRELSIEEKAKRYDETLEKARQLCTYPTTKPFISDLQDLFPELAESEDERIRKQIISFLKEFEYDHYRCLDFSSWIAWLEKQGEQKPVDKVEPKYKISDWIVEPREGEPDGLWHIDRIEDGCYWSGKCGCTIEYADKNFHLWTIEDAKDGDVLAFNDGHGNDCIELIKSITGKTIVFAFCLTNGNSYEVFDGIAPYTNFASRKDAIPASKEQRDFLFQKMKEAGYKWDANKNELIKL